MPFCKSARPTAFIRKFFPDDHFGSIYVNGNYERKNTSDSIIQIKRKSGSQTGSRNALGNRGKRGGCCHVQRTRRSFYDRRGISAAGRNEKNPNAADF
jgi:hypothetical protein